MFTQTKSTARDCVGKEEETEQYEETEHVKCA